MIPHTWVPIHLCEMFRLFCFGPCQCAWSQNKTHETSHTSVWEPRYIHVPETLPFPPADPYVKVWLMFGEKRVEKKKTVIYKCNLNPIFNATFEFDVPWEQIRDCALDVQVMDFDTVGRNELIGKVLLACEYK